MTPYHQVGLVSGKYQKKGTGKGGKDTAILERKVCELKKETAGGKGIEGEPLEPVSKGTSGRKGRIERGKPQKTGGSKVILI